MKSERTFTNVDDAALVSLLSKATKRVVFVAPGLRQVVASALVEALARLPDKVMVVLDVDAEVCRLGYGDEKGLLMIKEGAEKAGSRLHHQPGVRIGLLIVDNDTVVYSPVPLLIEAGSDQPDKPNAIFLSGNVPAAIESACGLGVDADSARQVGLEFVNDATLEEVQADLKASPPKPYNIARIERVFNSALHFVELEILGYRLRTKKITLDVVLFGMDDPFLRERVENTFKPFDDAEFLTVKIPKLDADGNQIGDQTQTFGPEVIEDERKRIKGDFLFDIPGFGVVIRRANKQEFEQRVGLLKQQIELYINAVKKNIQDHLENAKQKLKASLLEKIMKTPPAAWKKYMNGDRLSEDEAGRLLDEALGRAFAGMISEFCPTIEWVYKDVTFDTIHNEKFRKGLEKSFGAARAEKLFSEYDAAPEAQS